MYMIIRLPLGCLLILLYTYAHFCASRRLHTLSSGAFDLMVCFGILHLVSATVTEYSVNHRDTFPAAANYLWHTVFLISIVSVCFSLYFYLLISVEKSTARQRSGERLFMYSMWLAAAAALYLAPIEYVDTPDGSYSLGPKAYVLYAFVIFVFVMIIRNLVLNRKALRRQQCSAFAAAMLVFLLVSAVQMLFPYILIADLGITLIILGIMMTIEDSHQFYDSQLDFCNEYGCRRLLDDHICRPVPFDIAIYVLSGDQFSTADIAMSIKSFYERHFRYYSCCMIGGDTVVVLPPASFRRTKALQGLPFSPSHSKLVRVDSTLLPITAPLTTDEVMQKIYDYRAECMKQDSLTDELTGALRRTAFIGQVNRAIAAGKPFSFLMLDVDDFKTVNDTYGHTVGDDVLRGLAECFRQTLREHDVICRMGGDEFAILLPGIASKEIAAEVVGRVKRRLPDLPIAVNRGVEPRISVGGKVCDPDREVLSFEEIYTAADSALYQAKKSGKNRICFAGESADA